MYSAKIASVTLDEEGLHVDVLRFAPTAPDLPKRYEAGGLTKDQFLAQVRADLAKVNQNAPFALELLSLQQAGTPLT